MKFLITASLMSVAYPNYDYEDNKLTKLFVPFSPEKKFYLNSYIRQHQLEDYVSINKISNEFSIKVPEIMSSEFLSWFENREKIFMKSFITEREYQAIIIFINLFGIRQFEGIAMSTSISQKYLFTLSFSISRLLNVKTVLANKQIKIIDATELFLQTVYKTTSLDSSNIAGYLLNKEKKTLQKTVKILEKKQRKDVYV